MRTIRTHGPMLPDTGRTRGGRPLASVLAFGLAILGEAASVALVIGSDSDPAGVRWPARGGGVRLKSDTLRSQP